MSHSTTIQSYIDQNQWSQFAIFLQSQKGFIAHRIGGRYFGGNNIEKDGCSSLDNVCRKVFEASFKGTMQKAAPNELQAINTVVGEFKRLYNEAESKLLHASVMAWAGTQLYDKLQECLDDGYSPVEQLEKKLLPFLSTQMKV